MMRLLIAVSLPLVLIFTGIGVLFSHEWGWSEYASPALYVVYYTGSQGVIRYLIVNADGGSDGAPLTWQDDPITTLGCSPDGRTFAVFTRARHLYVLTRAGLAYDKQVDRPYDDVRVKNNQTVSLYLEDSYGISLNADKFANLSSFLRYDWLASEQLYLSGSSLDVPYLRDLRTRLAFPVPYFFPPPLSPDGTKAARSLSGADNQWRIEVVDFLSQQPITQFPDGSEFVNAPICFLTFRPQMLIAGS